MSKTIPWILDKVKAFNETVWHTSLSDISKSRSFLIKQVRIIVLAARGFMKDKVQMRASALTFYSLLSIIPVAAIAFAIAKGFGLDQNLEDLVIKELQSQPEVLNWLLKQTRTALQETKGGYIAGVGVIILFWSVMSLLDQIESSLNHIWQVASSRPWYRKFTDYLTIMLIAPVILILSSSITVFISTELSDFISSAPILDFFKPVISLLVRFIPYLLAWMALTALYIVIPNTKVKFLPALVSGIIAGTFLQLLQWLYIDLQFGISKLSSIYGSFAAIPLFILWLQSSWIIVLLGAELSFANQNLSRYEFESEALNVSNYQKRALSLMIMHLIIRNFSEGTKPISAETIARDLKLPVRLVRDILQDLGNADLVSVIQRNEHAERLFQPALDINKLTVNYILGRLDRRGEAHQIIVKSKEYNKVTMILDKFEKLSSKSDMNILVKDL
ncbi:MAG: YihY family inner membrane protein [Bacteroidales bacterium]|jgi:membrane protein|nr:YihY family inner membrane protein [Bacteroidales bacterium]HQG78016.1 YihY/virulence factor BrkB family protein [Bacteroidales bacterium]